MDNNRNIILKRIWVWLLILSPIFSFANDFSIGESRPQTLPTSELIDIPNSKFSKSITLNQVLRKQLPKNLFTHFYQLEISTLALILNHFNQIEFAQITNQFLSYSNTEPPILIPQLFRPSKREKPFSLQSKRLTFN